VLVLEIQNLQPRITRLRQGYGVASADDTDGRNRIFFRELQKRSRAEHWVAPKAPPEMAQINIENPGLPPGATFFRALRRFVRLHHY
jgi:hypothetical protein